MFILDTATRRLQILLGGAGAIPFVSSYVTISTTTQGISSEGTTPGVTNGVTPVDLVPVPPASSIRQVKWFVTRNSTGGAVSPTIRYDDNGTSRDFTFTLDAGDTLQYTDTEGFRVFTSAGALKGTGGGAGASLTVEEVDGAPTVASVATLRFDQADGFVVSSPGAGIARVDFTGGSAVDNDAQTIAMLALMGFGA